MQITLISRPLRFILTLLKILRSDQNLILERVTKTMADVTALVAEVAKLKADTSTALKDIADKLGAIKPEDPAVQAAIDSAVADLTKLDSDIVAADPGPVA